MRRCSAAATAILSATVLVSGCGSGKTPPGHEQRLLKAAGVTRFQITCTKDIWEATKGYNEELDGVTVTDRKGKVYTYELTGTELVAYLKGLEADAYGPTWNRGWNEEQAKRMDGAISPTVGTVKPDPGPDALVPRVALNDSVATESSDAPRQEDTAESK